MWCSRASSWLSVIFPQVSHPIPEACLEATAPAGSEGEGFESATGASTTAHLFSVLCLLSRTFRRNSCPHLRHWYGLQPVWTVIVSHLDEEMGDLVTRSLEDFPAVEERTSQVRDGQSCAFQLYILHPAFGVIPKRLELVPGYLDFKRTARVK